MEVEMVFEKFDLIAQAPGAIDKLRDLIRTFAIQGKLVAQDNTDQPAIELVKKVASSLPNKGSANPFLSEIEPNIIAESDYMLPDGWAWIPLGHIGIWATGCGFPKQYQGEIGGEFLFCKVSDMNLPGNELEIRTTVNTITSEVMKQMRVRANPAGTVIFPKIGGAIATHKRRVTIRPTIIDNNCSGIKPIGLTDTRWLFLLLRSIDLTRYQSGTSVPAVSQGSLDPIRVGLPPLAEQRRIVAKVDELMALCDRLEAEQNERESKHANLARAALARFAEDPSLANLEYLFHNAFTIDPADLRKSILTLAVQGMLVPQDLDDGAPTAIEVGELELASGQRFEIPEQWRWMQLGDLAVINGGFAFKSTAYTAEGTRVVRISDFDEYGFKDHKVVRHPFAPEMQKFSLVEENILMAMTGGTVGKSYFVRGLPERMLVNQRVAAIKVAPPAFPAYIDIVIRSEMTQEVIRQAKNSTNDNISMADIKGFAVPLPPIAEQKRIVAKVDTLMALVDQLEAQLVQSRAVAGQLIEAVVAELTKQG